MFRDPFFQDSLSALHLGAVGAVSPCFLMLPRHGTLVARPNLKLAPARLLLTTALRACLPACPALPSLATQFKPKPQLVNPCVILNLLWWQGGS